MTAGEDGPFGVLLDIDGVLYVGDEPIEGARQAFSELRELSASVRLMTNTTSRSRRAVREHLLGMGFDVSLDEVLTPAAMAERHCHQRGYGSVTVLVSEALREDLTALDSAAPGAHADAVVLGDLDDGFTPEVLNGVFRALMDGADLVALQHNRYWRRADGLALDVGAYAAALEYASGREAVTVGKPVRAFSRERQGCRPSRPASGQPRPRRRIRALADAAPSVAHQARASLPRKGGLPPS